MSSISPVGKIAKKNTLKVCDFVDFGTQNTVPCCQKYTPTDCFFGDLPTGSEPTTLYGVN